MYLNGGPAVIIKDEVMIDEEAIVADQDVLCDDHHDDPVTPSSSLESAHQPEVKGEVILQDGIPEDSYSDVIMKCELVMEEPISAEEARDGPQDDLTRTSSRLASQRSHPPAIQAGSNSSIRGEKPYACDSCDYRTGHLSHLKTHIRTHTGEKPHACDSCDFRTGRLSDLKRHKRTHSGEKPHTCDSCDYRTGHVGDLKRHMKTHSGEKPHTCGICDYRTGDLGHLKRHVRSHTGTSR